MRTYAALFALPIAGLLVLATAGPSAADPPPGNQPPVAVDDSYSLHAGTEFSLPIPGYLGNDFDPDGDDFQLDSMLTNPTHLGSLTWVNAEGGIAFTPEPGYVGPDSFTYQIRDEWGQLSNVATVHISWLNDAPIAVNDTYTIDQDTTLHVPAASGLLANDSEPDGDSFIVVGTTSPNHAAQLNWTGQGELLYEPTPGYSGVDTFSYQVADPFGATDTALVTIIVNSTAPPPGTSAPIANDDSFTMESGTTGVFNPTANDTDPDGDPLLITELSIPSDHGTVSTPTPQTIGFTADQYFVGSIHGTYRVKDSTNAVSNEAKITLTIVPPASNQLPVPADDFYNVTGGTPLTVAAPGLLANDVDADGDPLQMKTWGMPEHGTLTITELTGAFTYTPDPGYSGVDSFEYRIADPYGFQSSKATVTFQVDVPAPCAIGATGPCNDAPAPVGDAYSVIAGEKLVVPAAGVLANDTDPNGDPIELASHDDSALTHGTLGAVSADGSFEYTAAADYIGTQHFEYTVKDIWGLTGGPALVEITILPSPTMPGPPVVTPPGPPVVTPPDPPQVASPPTVTAPPVSAPGPQPPDHLAVTGATAPAWIVPTAFGLLAGGLLLLGTAIIRRHGRAPSRTR